MTRLTDADRERARQRRAAIAACGRCDELGWLIIGGRAHRCPHPGIQDTPQQQPVEPDQTAPKRPPESTETD